MKTTKHSDGSVDVDLEGAPSVVDFEITIHDTVSPVDEVAREAVSEITGWPSYKIQIECIRPEIDSDAYGRGTQAEGFVFSNRKTMIDGKYVPEIE